MHHVKFPGVLSHLNSNRGKARSACKSLVLQSAVSDGSLKEAEEVEAYAHTDNDVTHRKKQGSIRYIAWSSVPSAYMKLPRELYTSQEIQASSWEGAKLWFKITFVNMGQQSKVSKSSRYRTSKALHLCWTLPGFVQLPNDYVHSICSILLPPGDEMSPSNARKCWRANQKVQNWQVV